MTTNKKKNETLPTATLRVPRTRNDMAWSFGAAEVGGKTYRVQIKWFDEPSMFGIRRGRVSKLYVAAAGEGAVLDYDRGWITRASTAEAKAILKAILKEFN